MLMSSSKALGSTRRYAARRGVEDGSRTTSSLQSAATRRRSTSAAYELGPIPTNARANPSSATPAEAQRRAGARARGVEVRFVAQEVRTTAEHPRSRIVCPGLSSAPLDRLVIVRELGRGNSERPVQMLGGVIPTSLPLALSSPAARERFVCRPRLDPGPIPRPHRQVLRRYGAFHPQAAPSAKRAAIAPSPTAGDGHRDEPGATREGNAEIEGARSGALEVTFSVVVLSGIIAIRFGRNARPRRPMGIRDSNGLRPDDGEGSQGSRDARGRRPPAPSPAATLRRTKRG